MTNSAQAPARALADSLGVVLASDLPEPPPPPRIKAFKQRLSGQVEAAFKELSPRALCVVATEAPLFVRRVDRVTADDRALGAPAMMGNKPCWPVRLASSAQYQDTVTKSWDRNPFAWTGVKLRVWCASEEHERRLAEAVQAKLDSMAEVAEGETLRCGFRDLGPDLDFSILEMEIMALAEALGVPAWDDEALVVYLQRRVAERAERAKQRARW